MACFYFYDITNTTFRKPELAKKVKRGLTENALKGLWNGGNVPFGYVINKERKLEINPTTTPIVKEIFQMCFDGKTIKDLEYFRAASLQTNDFIYKSVRDSNLFR